MEMALSVRLLDELLNILRTYTLRLEALERTFHDSAEEVAVSIMRNLTAIRLENQQGFVRLKTGLEQQLKRAQEEEAPGEEFAVLSSVWKTERMKGLYSIALQQIQAGCTLCRTWNNRPDILQAMAQHNLNVMGVEGKAHISVFTYPGLIKDHLFNVRNVLNECLKEAVKGNYKTVKVIEAVIRRMDSLMEWLDRSLVTLPTAKNIKASIIPEHERGMATSEPLLRRGIFTLPVHNHLDAEKIEIFLGSTHIVFRLSHNSIFKTDKWEFGWVEELDVEEGDDDYTLNLYGVGLRKILTAKSIETRDDWMEAIIELRDAVIEQNQHHKATN